MSTEAELANGSSVFFNAPPDAVAAALNKRGLVRLPSGRHVNAGQVVQLLPVSHVPSIHTPEQLED